MSKPAIVLAHGIIHPLGAATDVLLKRSYFRVVPDELRKRGFRVLEPKVSNMGHVRERAEQLMESILAWDELERGEKVHLIAHSMGGLDSREMISNMHGHELVNTLVSIGTPHKGCCVADFILDQVPLMDDVAARLERLGMSLSALSCLAMKNATAFNQSCPDKENVRYFSVSGRKGSSEHEYSTILRPSFKYVTEREGPNDGMVSVTSAIWGQHLGTLPYDHIEQIDELELYEKVLQQVVMPPSVVEERVKKALRETKTIGMYIPETSHTTSTASVQ